MSNLSERFERYNDDYLKFDDVENKLSKRPDIHAFIVIDSVTDRSRDLVCSAGHDEIYLDVTKEEIEKLSDEQLRDLVRSGVRYDDEEESLCMFV